MSTKIKIGLILLLLFIIFIVAKIFLGVLFAPVLLFSLVVNNIGKILIVAAIITGIICIPSSTK